MESGKHVRSLTAVAGLVYMAICWGLQSESASQQPAEVPAQSRGGVWTERGIPWAATSPADSARGYVTGHGQEGRAGTEGQLGIVLHAVVRLVRGEAVVQYEIVNSGRGRVFVAKGGLCRVSASEPDIGMSPGAIRPFGEVDEWLLLEATGGRNDADADLMPFGKSVLSATGVVVMGRYGTVSPAAVFTVELTTMVAYTERGGGEPRFVRRPVRMLVVAGAIQGGNGPSTQRCDGG
jgi:hypothetical protein